MVILSGFCGTAPDKDRRDRFRRALTRRSSQYYAVLSKYCGLTRESFGRMSPA